MENIIHQRLKIIKDYKDKYKLTISAIMDIVTENGGYVSEGTAKKVFKDGSEDMGFHTSTILTIYDALVKKFGNELPTDTDELHNIVFRRNREIDRLVLELERLTERYGEKEKLFEERKKIYEQTIEILKSQIEKQNEQIQAQEAAIIRKDEYIRELLGKYLLKE